MYVRIPPKNIWKCLLKRLYIEKKMERSVCCVIPMFSGRMILDFSGGKNTPLLSYHFGFSWKNVIF
jgi:hypothetical protein